MAERRVLRFFGRGDLLVVEPTGITVCDPDGQTRFRTEIAGIIDAIAVGDELWVATTNQLVSCAMDGQILRRDPIYLDPQGRFLQSSTAPHLPVWHASRPVLVRRGGEVEVPGSGGELIFPIAEDRWLLWQGGQLRYWRTMGSAWRHAMGEPGSRPIDAQLVLDGRLFVLVQRRAGTDGNELRIAIAAVSNGDHHAHLRLQAVSQLVIIARRGLAIARVGDSLSVIDLRFGRWLRNVVLPAGVTEIAIDDGVQQIALGTADGVQLMPFDALATATSEPEAEGAREDSTNGISHTIAVAVVPPPEPPPEPASEPLEVADDSLPADPLVRFDPIAVTPTATPNEVAQAVEVQLQWIGARVAVAIAVAWDSGQISRGDPARPPFAEEVAGLFGVTVGRAQEDLAEAVNQLRRAEEILLADERARGNRLTPLDVLARDFQLTPMAVAILFAVAAPMLRGDFARAYGILSNDPSRPLVDEHLLGKILGSPGSLARELDGDRPLRRYGLVQMGSADRPFASLSVDPLVVRCIANQPAEGEPDRYLIVGRHDRELDELRLPRALVIKALRFLAMPRDGEPVRIVVRGRTGSGRHTLLRSLAARAGRALGVIDLANIPREPGVLAQTVEAVLRRAMLRGLVPCIDGLELISSDEPDAKTRVGLALRNHPGPLALCLASDARIPLDPGYLQLDIPGLNERERGESWSIALARHQIDLPDPGELAARYRVGPGIIERVCAEVVRHPSRPSDGAGWVRELDDAVRQHLENRLGTTATRVTRLASWADVVLPEDITDSLLELTARVRHRKTVFEQWGFDRSMATSRGITALFQGSPGTGKTMVAGVIARDLGLDLYRVDVSRITSKWIGETEKNLGSLFDAAEEGQVMLLFDEADSLFAKRTEVKTSVDRYANMEVNYLLQRFDSFEGIAILTTNFGSAIDPAFKRRLTYRVTFPFPDEEMREQLWKSLIPAQTPVHGKLDFAGLSHRFRLSGGYIRNAALRAAFLAAEEGSALTHSHLERAIRMEFREIGKLAETGTLE